MEDCLRADEDILVRQIMRFMALTLTYNMFNRSDTDDQQKEVG